MKIGKTNHKMPFKKRVPSLFIVGSPFQILCAYEAINELEIKKYTIFLMTVENDPRRDQSIGMLKQLNIEYKIVKREDISMIKSIQKFNSNDAYERIFLGDYCDVEYHLLALCYAKYGTNICYTDDGNAMISILRKNMSRSECRSFKIIKFLAKLMSVNFDDNFFTIYHDIKTDKTILPNNFRCLASSFSLTTRYNTLYFVGTNPDQFCKQNEIDTDFYYRTLEKILIELKQNYLCDGYIYIAHGKDNSKQTIEICARVGFNHTRLVETIESHLLKTDIIPFLVSGFSSTALLNLKVLMDCKVINYYIVNEKAKQFNKYKDIAEYYLERGIVEKRIIYTNK